MSVMVTVMTLNLSNAFCQDDSKVNTEAVKEDRLCLDNVDKNNFKDAIKHGKKAVKLDKTNSQYYYMLGNAYGIKAQSVGKLAAFAAAKKCRSSYEKAVELDAGNLDARSSLVSFYSMAPGIVGGGIKKAKKQAEAISNIDKVLGHKSYAQIYAKEKDFDKAEKEYKAAIELSDNKSLIHINLGLMYQQTEKWDLAAEQFITSVKLDSAYKGAYYHLANNCLLRGDEYLQGVMHSDFFIDSVDDDINKSWGHYMKGRLYEKLAVPEDAREAYTKALKLNPACKPAEKALKKLK